MPIGIDQRAAGIAGVDRRVRLDEILEGVDAEMIAAQCRDNPHRDGLADPKRVADGEHDVADLGVVDPRQRDRRQFFQVDLDDGKIRLRVGANQSGRNLAAIGQGDLNFVG